MTAVLKLQANPAEQPPVPAASPAPPITTATGNTGQPPLLVPLAEVARLLSRSVASLHRDRAAGRFGPKPIKLGASVLFSVAEIEEWIRAGAPDQKTWQAMRAAEADRGAGRRT